MRYWEALSPFIQSMRFADADPAYYTDFEFLVRRMVRYQIYDNEISSLHNACRDASSIRALTCAIQAIWIKTKHIIRSDEGYGLPQPKTDVLRRFLQAELQIRVRAGASPFPRIVDNTPEIARKASQQRVAAGCLGTERTTKNLTLLNAFAHLRQGVAEAVCRGRSEA
jgi:hypothetical protein